MKKIILYSCMIASLGTNFTDDSMPDREQAAAEKNEATNCVSAKKILEQFFMISAEHDIYCSDELQKIGAQLATSEDMGLSALTGALQEAADILEPLIADNEWADTLHRQLVQEYAALVIKQSRTALAGLQVVNKLAAYKQLATDVAGIIGDIGSASPDSNGDITFNAASTAGSTVAFYGYDSTIDLLVTSPSLGNTIIGLEAGNSAMSGTENTGLGYQALALNSTGEQNVAIGYTALHCNTTGSYNTAVGYSPLRFNSTGANNTAVGWGTLYGNSVGYNNTAVGEAALIGNSGGVNNTALGLNSLFYNTTGSNNVAVGFETLLYNTTGINNVAVGTWALGNNTIGAYNVAVGLSSLISNTTGINNVAVGTEALGSNKTGNNNTAVGYAALVYNPVSNNVAVGYAALLNNLVSPNTAIGYSALAVNTTGTDNIALGHQAGINYTGGESSNIIIGNAGSTGESNVVRIGTNQMTCYIAGISGATSSSGTAVFINSNGRLGTTTSSQRYKDGIAPMKQISDTLLAMQPVEFYYKNDENQQKQYGLIAENVAGIDSSLVMYNAQGSPETIYYQFLPPLLLKGWQEHNDEINAAKMIIKNQQHEIEMQRQEFDQLKVVVKAQQEKLDAFFERSMKV